MDVLGPPDPATRAEWIEVYVKRKARTKLAPLVERLANLREGDGDGSGAVRFRPVTRKVLAFDPQAGMLDIVAFLVFYCVASSLLFGPYVFLVKGDPRGLYAFASGLLVLGVGVLGCAFAMAGRLRALRRILARCVVVPARVTGVLPWRDSTKTSFSLTFEYVYAGARYRADLVLGQWECSFLGPTPELLVDTQNPGSVLMRAFYA